MLFVMFKAHSGLRWLLVLAFVAVLTRLYLLFSKKEAFTPRDEKLLLAFTILLDVQILLGLVMFVWDAVANDFLPLYRVEHGVLLLIAGLLGHLPRRWKTLEATERAKKSLLAVAVAAALVVLGVAMLPQGW